jgi:hypothetical protein
MRRVLLIVGVVIFFASAAFAQTAPVLAWTHDGANLDHFTVTIDGQAPVSVGLPTPTNGLYSWTLPALTPTAHTFVVTACNALGACASSAPFSVAVPNAPTGLRVSP